VFIAQSRGCRKLRGIHTASDYTKWALGQCDADRYTLKLDARKFFYSIDRDILISLLRRKFKDKRLLALMALFMRMPNSDKGIPIGNLLSQLYALIYLNPLDQFIKHTLRQRLYIRYVDDFILFNLTLDEAHEKLSKIREFLRGKLGLELSKYSVAKARNGVNFVGYRAWATHRLARKRSMYNFRKAVKAGNQESIASLLGHAKRTWAMAYYMGILDRAREKERFD
jgi:retron-type reverse transcriptase